MTPDTEFLGSAQDKIRHAARNVTMFASDMAVYGPGWGTQRMDYIAQAICHLNSAFSLVRAAVNENTLPGVHHMARPHQQMPMVVPVPRKRRVKKAKSR